ncbi:hypothetical protein G7081_01180 [Vagococcus coleopterorum]|uniref:Uncharacterized protein n=1 Tax=Vagococcus coleopterorum TaxID=2714946 RepID=A0A6G8ALD1_9ENTE|nr:hypothetical protein [Vagococcus coleopterorum]QIL45797.1 hypothetical protein G7081_01180 [Vagococcus coleopterorum]
MTEEIKNEEVKATEPENCNCECHIPSEEVKAHAEEFKTQLDDALNQAKDHLADVDVEGQMEEAQKQAEEAMAKFKEATKITPEKKAEMEKAVNGAVEDFKGIVDKAADSGLIDQAKGFMNNLGKFVEDLVKDQQK